MRDPTRVPPGIFHPRNDRHGYLGATVFLLVVYGAAHLLRLIVGL
jgi:hypothetical protein